MTSGAGRMIRSPTVFEEVVKTICTTNCTWSATIRMVSALVEHLGEPAPGATDRPLGHAFPTPEAMARKKDAVSTLKLSERAIGASTCRSLARSVASGKLDLEALGTASADECPTTRSRPRLLALLESARTPRRTS